jgi:hypothetical protein
MKDGGNYNMVCLAAVEADADNRGSGRRGRSGALCARWLAWSNLFNGTRDVDLDACACCSPWQNLFERQTHCEPAGANTPLSVVLTSAPA